MVLLTGAQILMGLADIHGCNVVHFDLKPKNIMWFSKEHKFKLLDLGSSVFTGSRSHQCTTLNYTAPEVVQAAQRRRRVVVEASADMWSFGMIAIEVLAGVFCFEFALSKKCMQGKNSFGQTSCQKK